MKMEIPILTSHFSFAKSICENSALYFDPLDADDVVLKIMRIINDKELSARLVKNGRERLKAFGNAETRAERYFDVFKSI